MTKWLLSILVQLTVFVPVAATQTIYECACKNGSVSCSWIDPNDPNANFYHSMVCSSACSSRGGVLRSGPKGSCTAIEIVPYSELVQHVKHAIWHQGADTWAGPDNSDSVHGDQLRFTLLSAAGNDPNRAGDSSQLRATMGIRNASIADLERARNEALQECHKEHPPDVVFGDLEWVAHHGVLNKPRIVHWRKTNEYGNIRSLFSNTEAHDDNKRNAIYCYSGKEIAAFVDKLP
jgi:hypothetical protein